MSRRVFVIGLVGAAVAAGGWAFFMNKSPLTPPPAADGAAAAAPDGVVTEVDRTVDWGAAAAKAGTPGVTS